MTDNAVRWHHRLFVGVQYLLPQHLLSALMFRAARVRWRPLKNLIIRAFVRQYHVDMAEAEETDPQAFESFNAFFTRSLRPDARPLLEQANALACPADGLLSQFGKIDAGRIFQCKGLDYSLLDLVGGRADWSKPLENGSFATIYLSPRDYHRVHMPIAGTLREMIHVPGRLFSVNSVTAALVPSLFARNERVLCLFDTAVGPMVLILVGAIFVGSMQTVWADRVTGSAGGKPSTWRYDDRKVPIYLEQGAEMGRFEMGSTVILLLPPHRLQWSPGLRPGAAVRVREAICRLLDPIRQPGDADSAQRGSSGSWAIS